jgi:hypothetical protein
LSIRQDISKETRQEIKLPAAYLRVLVLEARQEVGWGLAIVSLDGRMERKEREESNDILPLTPWANGPIKIHFGAPITFISSSN